MIERAWVRAIPVGLAFAAASGCGAEDGVVDEDVGQVGIYLSSVPSNGTCLRFTSTAGARTIQQSFDASSGAAFTAALRGLPYNVSLSISAEAFMGACSALTPASLATYLSDTLGATLAPGETKNLAFTLRPTGNVNGTAEFIFLTLSPTSRAFGNVVIPQEGTPMPFTLTNIGMIPTSTLAASILESSGGTGQFTIASSTCDTELAPSATCTVAVKLTPTTSGAKSGTLQVSGMTGGTVTAMLSGIGWTPARLSISPSYNFGAAQLNYPFNSMVLSLSNMGDEPTGTPNISLSPSGTDFSISSNTCTGSLEGHRVCNISIRFVPTTLAQQSATLTVTAPSGGTVTTALSGSGAPPLISSPTSASFGSAPVGATGMSQTFAIRNAGVLTSALLTVASSTPDFRITSDGCSAKSLPPGASCNVTVQLVPSAAGPLEGTLTVNGASGWIAQAALTGSGT